MCAYTRVFWDMTPFYSVKRVCTQERIPKHRNTQQKLTWKYLQTVAHFLFLSTPFAEDTAIIGMKLVYRIQPLHHPRTNAQQVAQVTLRQMMVTASYLEQPCDTNKHLHTQQWPTYWIQNPSWDVHSDLVKKLPHPTEPIGSVVCSLDPQYLV